MGEGDLRGSKFVLYCILILFVNFEFIKVVLEKYTKESLVKN